MSAVVRFRAIGPNEVSRQPDGTHTVAGPPPEAFWRMVLLVTSSSAVWILLAGVFLPLSAQARALAAMLFVGLLGVPYLLYRLNRELRSYEVRADRSGAHSWKLSVPWSGVDEIFADLVGWSPDGDPVDADSYFEYAVVLVRAEDRLAFFVDSADQAETLVEQLSFLRSGARGSPEDVPEALRPLTARATQQQ